MVSAVMQRYAISVVESLQDMKYIRRIGARRVGKAWRSRRCESNFQGGKTGADEKMDLPEGRS